MAGSARLGRVQCWKCAGTGAFAGGICYRCTGKGFIEAADQIRNFTYDTNVPQNPYSELSTPPPSTGRPAWERLPGHAGPIRTVEPLYQRPVNHGRRLWVSNIHGNASTKDKLYHGIAGIFSVNVTGADGRLTPDYDPRIHTPRELDRPANRWKRLTGTDTASKWRSAQAESIVSNPGNYEFWGMKVKTPTSPGNTFYQQRDAPQFDFMVPIWARAKTGNNKIPFHIGWVPATGDPGYGLGTLLPAIQDVAEKRLFRINISQKARGGWFYGQQKFTGRISVYEPLAGPNPWKRRWGRSNEIPLEGRGPIGRGSLLGREEDGPIPHFDTPSELTDEPIISAGRRARGGTSSRYRTRQARHRVFDTPATLGWWRDVGMAAKGPLVDFLKRRGNLILGGGAGVLAAMYTLNWLGGGLNKPKDINRPSQTPQYYSSSQSPDALLNTQPYFYAMGSEGGMSTDQHHSLTDFGSARRFNNPITSSVLERLRRITGDVFQKAKSIVMLGAGNYGRTDKISISGYELARKSAHYDESLKIEAGNLKALAGIRGVPEFINLSQDENLLTMELVPGAALSKLGPMSDPDARAITRQTTATIYRMARRGYRHGDLFPRNIIAELGSTPKGLAFNANIVDFGILQNWVTPTPESFISHASTPVSDTVEAISRVSLEGKVAGFIGGSGKVERNMYLIQMHARRARLQGFQDGNMGKDIRDTLTPWSSPFNFKKALEIAKKFGYKDPSTKLSHSILSSIARELDIEKTVVRKLLYPPRPVGRPRTRPIKVTKKYRPFSEMESVIKDIGVPETPPDWQFTERWLGTPAGANLVNWIDELEAGGFRQVDIAKKLGTNRQQLRVIKRRRARAVSVDMNNLMHPQNKSGIRNQAARNANLPNSNGKITVSRSHANKSRRED